MKDINQIGLTVVRGTGKGRRQKEKNIFSSSPERWNK